MKHHRVTVLMPVFNAEQYLAEAINSILHQSFTNFEFLIIDDGSTDNSLNIIRSFSDARIRLVINEANMGISAALNKGVTLATTELIARMDADDISYPQRLELQVAHFISYPETALLSTSVREITADKQVVEIFNVDAKYIWYNMHFICPIYHPTVMYRRSVVLNNGGYRTPYSEDYDLWWRLSKQHKLDHIKEILLDYRLSPGSLSNVTKKQEYRAAACEQLQRNIDFLAGYRFELTPVELECLRSEFSAMSQAESVSAIAQYFRKLDVINSLIVKIKSPYYAATDLQLPMREKRHVALMYFYSRLPVLKRILLLVKTGNLPMLFKRLNNLFHLKARLLFYTGF